MPYAILGLITMVLWIYCIVDVITCPETEVRNLPKLVWLLIVLLIPTIGSIVWLVAGRPVGPDRRYDRPTAGSYVEYERPGRAVAQNPEDDAEFLRRCRERAEQQRLEAKRQNRPTDDSA